MLDEAATARQALCDQPRIELTALTRLRQLVDQFANAAGQGHEASGFMVVKGDRHETRTRKPTPPTSANTDAATADA
jgi:hypothetical protein